MDGRGPKPLRLKPPGLERPKLNRPRLRRPSLKPRGLKRRVAGRGGVLAHLVTFTNLGCGFAALLLAFEGYPSVAVSLIFLCSVLDFVDGALARLAGHGSLFGKELDSLADVVSFGVVPAFLAYQAQAATAPSSAVAGLVSLVFVVGGAWRLALFNVLEVAKDFRGLPITVAGGILAALAYLAPAWPWPVLALLTLGLSFLMVCRVRFVKLSRVLIPAVKRLPDQLRWASGLLLIPLGAIILQPIPQAVLALGGIYIVASVLEHRRTPAPAAMQEEVVH
jgi:CDP-diacylglycerol---serine O-phosphatidyltransferase